MAKVTVLTDNVAQVPPDIAKQLDIDTIHFSVIIEGKHYKDGIDITATDLYQRMRLNGILPNTSQPSLGEYINFFRKHLEKDSEHLLHITLPASLSGAFSTANAAAQLLKQEYPHKKIIVFDTGTVTISQGFLAITVAQAAQTGADIGDLTSLLEREKQKVGFLAMLQTLKYLELGGRVGKVAYLVGNMINIKPIITIDKQGSVAPLGNIRGERKILSRLVECMASQIGDRIPLRAAVMHADSLDDAKKLQQLTSDRFGLNEVLITDFTPVMGSHTGPGVLGLGYQLK